MYNKKPSFKSLLFKKMVRTIKRQPLQFLAMTLIMALGVAFFNGLFASYQSFDNQINEIIDKSNIADIHTNLYYKEIAKHKDDYKNDENIINNVIKDNGIVESNYKGSAKIKSFTSYISLSDNKPTISKTYNTEYKDEKENDDFLILTSRFLENSSLFGEYENWIDKDGKAKPVEVKINVSQFKKDIGEDVVAKFDEYTKEGADSLFVGDELTIIDTPTEFADNPESIFPQDTTPFTFYMSRKRLIKRIKETFDNKINKEELEKDTSPEAEKCKTIIENVKDEIIDTYFYNNRYYTKLKNSNEASYYSNLITNKFTHSTEKAGEILSNTDLYHTFIFTRLNSDARQALQLCFVLPPIFFLVALLVVLSTFSQIVLKERNEIGTFKAMGATNRNIFHYYLSLASIVSLLGILLGASTGPFIIPPLMAIKNQMCYTLPPMKLVFPWLSIVLCSLVILGFLTIITYFITKKESNLLPAISIRQNVIKNNIKTQISNKKSKSAHKICFKMALRNVMCNKARSIMVIIGVFGCTALLGCGFSVDDTINKGVNNDLQTYFNADAQIYFSYASDKTMDELNEMVDQGEIELEPYANIPGTMSQHGTLNASYDSIVYVINPLFNEFIKLPVMPDEKNIVITTKVANELHLKVDDYLDFNILGKSYYGRVSYIADAFYYHGIFIDQRNADYPKLEDIATNSYLRIKNKEHTNEIINKIKSMEGVSNVLDQSKMKNLINQLVTSVSYITAVIKTFAILLAVVVLYNLVLLNYNENIRNIATMKVLGFNKYEIMEALLYEIGLLTLIGTIFGLAVAYPFAILVLSVNKITTIEYLFAVTPLTYLYSFLISFGVAIFVDIYLAMKSNKIKMVESLKSVE